MKEKKIFLRPLLHQLEFAIPTVIIGIFTFISLYLPYIHVLNEGLGLGIIAIGILLALLYEESRIDSFVSKLPYTEFNGKKLYITPGTTNAPRINNLSVTSNLKPKILITDTALNSLSEVEIESLIEHEEGHIKLKHNLIGVFVIRIFDGLLLGTIPFLVIAILMVPNIEVSVSLFLEYLLLFSYFVYSILYSLISHNISEKEADWYAVKNVGIENYLRALNSLKLHNEGIRFRVRGPLGLLYQKYITIDDRMNIIENGTYEPFSYKETLQLLFPTIFILTVLATVILTYRIYPLFSEFSSVFVIIFSLLTIFSGLIILMVLSAIIYFILRSLGIKEYLARTSILAYYVITSILLLFPGIIEGIIISLVGVTVAVLISSSEGKLGRAMIGWGLVYIISLIGALSLLTSLGVV